MIKQDFYRRKYRQIKPKWKDSLTRYKEIINKYTKKDTWILDIGCGHGDFLKPVFEKTKHTYGLDPDKRALNKNKFIKHKIIGFADNLPFKENTFDLVVFAWVLEHLNNPEKVFTEVYRVLKPGGKTIFLTPNVWNYNVWIIRIIPDIFHDFLTKWLYNRQEKDSYPVRYKINSARKIDKTLLLLGFKKNQLILNGDPSYISFNKMLFKFACFLESLFDVKFLRFAKVHIIGIYQK